MKQSEKSMVKVEKNSIIPADCVDVMSGMKENSVDLLIADPPYNIGEAVGGWHWEEKGWDIVDEDWDSDDWSTYEQFTSLWLKEAARILKPTGSVWIFCSYHNSPFVNLSIRDHGEILNEVSWFKRDAFPNLSGRRFTASHETIYWGHLNGDDRDYYFDYELSKEIPCKIDHYAEADKQKRTVWDIPKSKLKPERVSDHPTQKSLRVYERIINLTSEPEDVVFFPFVGSGSGCVSAKLNNRSYIGTEANMEYAKMAKEYVDSIDKKPQAVIDESGLN